MNSTEKIKTDVINPIECFKEGWNLIKNDYWILFAVTIVGVMIGGITLYLLTGALICGVMKCYLQVIDGKEADFKWLFDDIKKNFGAGLLVTAVIIVPMIFVFSLVTLPGLLPLISGTPLTDEEFVSTVAVTLVIEFVIAFIMVCLHTLLMFAFPLIADKGLSGWEAMKTSANAVWQNKNGVAGLWAVGFVIGLLGFMLFCFGIYLTIPIVIAGNTVAYRKIFPKENLV